MIVRPVNRIKAIIIIIKRNDDYLVVLEYVEIVIIVAFECQNLQKSTI